MYAYIIYAKNQLILGASSLDIFDKLVITEGGRVPFSLSAMDIPI